MARRVPPADVHDRAAEIRKHGALEPGTRRPRNQLVRVAQGESHRPGLAARAADVEGAAAATGRMDAGLSARLRHEEVAEGKRLVPDLEPELGREIAKVSWGGRRVAASWLL
jgi:hypothetical protein